MRWRERAVEKGDERLRQEGVTEKTREKKKRQKRHRLRWKD